MTDSWFTVLLVNWLNVWLTESVSWLSHGLFLSLFDWLLAQLIGQCSVSLFNWFTVWLTDLSLYHLIVWLIHDRTVSLLDWFSVWLIYHHFISLFDCSFPLLILQCTNSLFDWFIVWLTHSCTVHCLTDSLYDWFINVLI